MLRAHSTPRALLTALSLPLLAGLLAGAGARPHQSQTDPATGLTRHEALGDASFDNRPGDTEFGDPLPDLSDSEFSLFLAGRDVFEEVESVADGIGPVFNGVTCANCHNGPAVGGGADVLSTRIGAVIGGAFDPLEAFGGPTIQTRGIGVAGEGEFVGEVVPVEATIVSRRRATPTLGFGLVDSVPDETLIFIAQMQRRFSPGTAGRPNFVVDLATGEQAVGRFGWKAQAATVFDFCADAYKDEMGITVPGLYSSSDGRNVADENCPQGDCGLLLWNPVASPNEGDTDDVAAFADFIRLLAPPPRGPVTKQVRAGAAVFQRIGCADCHLPTLRTGANDVAALARVTFHPFSDFLLHDMGALGDGIEQGTASGREMRTAPLWGLREQPAFLHDASAETIEEAILRHDGQARRARERYGDLKVRDRRDLLEFLNSL